MDHRGAKKLSFSRDIWGGAGARENFAGVVRRIQMAGGGWRVWQADKPV
jgi:hypothetical protein